MKNYTNVILRKQFYFKKNQTISIVLMIDSSDQLNLTRFTPILI